MYKNERYYSSWISLFKVLNDLNIFSSNVLYNVSAPIKVKKPTQSEYSNVILLKDIANKVPIIIEDVNDINIHKSEVFKQLSFIF